jgi:hypothetical protein
MLISDLHSFLCIHAYLYSRVYYGRIYNGIFFSCYQGLLLIANG